MDYTLYLITDFREKTTKAKVISAIKNGVNIIQFKDKSEDEDSKEKNAMELSYICKEYKVSLIVNDDVNLAKKVNADGVHLGQTDMKISEARKILGKEIIIGITAKTVNQAQEAEKNGANYLGCGAVFASKTKEDAILMDIDLLNNIINSVKIPVIAIGGIDVDNIASLLETRISGVALSNGILGSQNIEKTVCLLKDKMKEIYYE